MNTSSCRRYVLSVCFISFLSWLGLAPLVAQQPQSGVLLLKHGATLSGVITPAGDRYIVLLGESGEARVPATDVAAVVPDLQAAYEYKRSNLGDTFAARVELAQWCLQQGLLARAADQILAAERLYGRQSQLESLHQRLVALGTPQVSAKNEEPATVSKVSFEQEMGKLPHHTVDTFTSAVQPLLLNRCASGGCHNLRGTSEFILFRPFLGQATTQRMTAQNLSATLAYVDRASPLESLLLSKATAAHGGGVVPALEARESQQIAALTAWVRSLAVRRAATTPETISPTNEVLYQQGRSSGGTARGPKVDVSEAERPQKRTDPAGDPFDPTAFNLRHHGRPR